MFEGLSFDFVGPSDRIGDRSEARARALGAVVIDDEDARRLRPARCSQQRRG